MRFYAEIAKMIESPVFDPEYTMRVISENNDTATAWEDKIHSRIYVECENQPRDMPLHGVFWKQDAR
jgi:hypothetical protein